MKLVKLDTYDYRLLPGVIRIYVDGTTDPDLVDILSEIELTNGKIYVEGRYYNYLNKYKVDSEHNETYIDLHVVEIAHSIGRGR